ncbi:hypothetical protein G7Y89_g14574 [Cudoniella acicularis]|uniref:Uncharacterized protein n=1 Tax=Cudoniella acicularis TaxID=354080 RepID=A0A8H4R180_9HELO|nr:hypothetical protein G7Y89_g14574 [Cudoniella acicularis]
MAIQGTIDDEINADYNPEEEEWEAREREDVREWWSSLGFEDRDLGHLIREVVDTGMKPQVPERNISARKVESEERDCETIMQGLEIYSHHLTSPVRGVNRQSMPLSPLVDLGKVKTEEEIIPMGFNLGHDLGDFLNWEAKNVLTLFPNES